MYWIVVKQHGTDTDRLETLEFAECTAEDIARLPRDMDFYPEVGATLEVIHRTEAGARAAAERIARERGMPDDTWPGLWDNIGPRRLGDVLGRRRPFIVRD